VETKDERHFIRTEVFLPACDRDSVRVELYANGREGEDPVRQAMTRLDPLASGAGGFTFSATVSSARPATDYTPRIVPHHDGLSAPLEASWILWQK